ncbi:MAG TPA: HD-GYP domain-containing protein [Candidatus Aquicultor sp.]|jgi:HD-GYP domain-containing protein (c-di-GMP phosphodiesterase class II)
MANTMNSDSFPKPELTRTLLYEFAEMIDATLLPQVSISSVGLKLALQTKPHMAEVLGELGTPITAETFAKAIVKVMAIDFGISIIDKVVSDTHIQLTVTKCPFVEPRSYMMCQAIESVLGGFSVMLFGYGKVAPSIHCDQLNEPCSLHLFLRDTDEARNYRGITYSKDSIALLRSESENSESELAEEQRQARRKLILGLFGYLALVLRDNPDDVQLSRSFVASLSTIPGITAAALYIRDAKGDNCSLAAQYGFPRSIIPLAKGIDATACTDLNLEAAVAINKSDTEWAKALRRHSIRALTTVKLDAKDRVMGILDIGWSTPTAITPEVSEALRAVCILLANAIDRTRVYNDLEKVHLGTVNLLCDLVGIVDEYVKGHAIRVATIAQAIARQMGLPEDQVELIYEASLAHDIGKVSIPPDILTKTEALTPEEFKIIKTHPGVAAELLAPSPALRKLVPTILCHHERLDGSGYPEGVTGDNIPLTARILAVADSYDAMTCKRAYRDAMSSDEAIAELQKHSGTKYDETAVETLIFALNYLDLGNLESNLLGSHAQG